MRLKSCPRCARHVRRDAGTCPFCASELAVPSDLGAKFGAMVVGAATVSTLTGCPRPMTKYGAPPMPIEQVEQADEVDQEPMGEAEAPEADG